MDPVTLFPGAQPTDQARGAGIIPSVVTNFFFVSAFIGPHGSTVRLSTSFSGINVRIEALFMEIVRMATSTGDTEPTMNLEAPLGTTVASIRLGSGAIPESARLEAPTAMWYPPGSSPVSDTLRIITFDPGTGGTVGYQTHGFFVDYG